MNGVRKMYGYAETLNDLLVNAYELISKIEERMLHDLDKIDVSIRELHMMEYIGSEGNIGKTITAIAEKSEITLPSVTVAIKKLEKKGYVEKIKNKGDGRVVNVILTRQGKKVDAAHRYFHRKMVSNILKEIDEKDTVALIRGLTQLVDFFENTLEGMKKGSKR